MLSFRQKVFISYLTVFFILIMLMMTVLSQWVQHLIINVMDARATEIINDIDDVPNNEALIKSLKEHKNLLFFRVAIINDERRVIYDSHKKKFLGPKFSQEHATLHPEVLQAFEEGVGYHEEYSNLLGQKFVYYAKLFNFKGKNYVLRTAFPYKYISEIVSSFEIGFFIFASALLTLFSLMAWFIIQYLTKPIQRIINAVRSYQEGIEHTVLSIDTKNLNPREDFCKLALTLNSLSDTIQRHIDILTNERNEKEAILESLVEGVIALNENMEITYINHMAQKQINRTSEELLGQNFKMIGLKKCCELLEHCQQENQLRSDVLYLEDLNVYLDIIAAPKKEEGGAILVIQDKTAQHKLDEMRRDFVANASHELKTPITVIRGFAEAMHENPDLPKKIQKEITEKIVRNCNRMAAVIKDLLTLADVENIPSSRLSHFNLIDLINRCKRLLLDIFPDTLIQIMSAAEEISIYADQDLLELAILNLIENAAKYSKKPANISVLIIENNKDVKISITDQGIGIPAVDLEHIFDRFYTVDKAHSQKMGGSGLGLSIVKTIIEKHYGTISVKSTVGSGTTFTIQLPIDGTKNNSKAT